MELVIAESSRELGRMAARDGAELIRSAIRERGEAFIILATGVSQFEMLAELVRHDLPWSQVTAFHLDEYIGLPAGHPASFRKYLKERFADRVPVRNFHFIMGENDPVEECKRIGALISGCDIDVAFIGIGENAHLAFNDPPADFLTEDPYIVVTLDEACRLQQLNEGWFASPDEIPVRAISMSVRQILKSRHIICSVPEQRKAIAVQRSVEGPVTENVPASILQRHSACRIYLDPDSADLIKGKQPGSA